MHVIKGGRPIQHEFTTLVKIARWRAEQSPTERMYTFLLDGASDEAHLNFGELDRRARGVAAALQDIQASGQRALLLYQPGLDYIVGFLGCLYAGVTAVPSYPPDPFRMERTFPRFQAIVKDCNPVAVLTTSMIQELAGELIEEHPDFQGLHLIATDSLPASAARDWQAPDIAPDSLAFLQYTSGSTAEPRGVMLSHRNLMANLEIIRGAFGMREDSIGMIWLPPYHDMGLIGGILEPLYMGVPVVLMSPLDFLQRPLRWLQAITRYKATVSGGPNFAYDLCVRKVTPEQRATLDLSAWEVAFNGAEPVRQSTMDRFAEAFAECGFRKEAFYPCYGLAEATLIVSGGSPTALPKYRAVSASALALDQVLAAELDSSDSQVLVGCGTTLADQKIVIVDPVTETRLDGGTRVGEVWVAGDSIARGYWNRSEDSERTFGAYLASGEGPFLRTGDLGFLSNGELFITGRLKDLIIIDGRNHYPQDIELAVEASHPAVRPGCSAAFPITVDGGERLVVVTEIDRRAQPETLDAAEVVAAVRRAIAADHDLRVYAVELLKAGSVPKTSSGKVQRHAARASFLTGSLETWPG